MIMKPLGGSGLVKYSAKEPLQSPQTLTVADCLATCCRILHARAIPNMRPKVKKAVEMLRERGKGAYL
jgi:hypothetical protein